MAANIWRKGGFTDFFCLIASKQIILVMDKKFYILSCNSYLPYRSKSCYTLRITFGPRINDLSCYFYDIWTSEFSSWQNTHNSLTTQIHIWVSSLKQITASSPNTPVDIHFVCFEKNSSNSLSQTCFLDERACTLV